MASPPKKLLSHYGDRRHVARSPRYLLRIPEVEDVQIQRPRMRELIAEQPLSVNDMLQGRAVCKHDSWYSDP